LPTKIKLPDKKKTRKSMERDLALMVTVLKDLRRENRDLTAKNVLLHLENEELKDEVDNLNKHLVRVINNK